MVVLARVLYALKYYKNWHYVSSGYRHVSSLVTVCVVKLIDWVGVY